MGRGTQASRRPGAVQLVDDLSADRSVPAYPDSVRGPVWHVQVPEGAALNAQSAPDYVLVTRHDQDGYTVTGHGTNTHRTLPSRMRLTQRGRIVRDMAAGAAVLTLTVSAQPLSEAYISAVLWSAG
jgi:hypothetical protein